MMKRWISLLAGVGAVTLFVHPAAAQLPGGAVNQAQAQVQAQVQQQVQAQVQQQVQAQVQQQVQAQAQARVQAEAARARARLPSR